MKPMKKRAKTLKEPIDNVLTKCTHGITNGVADGISSLFMSIKRRTGAVIGTSKGSNRFFSAVVG